MYEGHFLSLSRLPCHRARLCFAVVSQPLFFVFVAYGTCIFLSTGSFLFVCPCAGLSGADSVNLLYSETSSTVLTAVFVTGSTWYLTAFLQTYCWWRKCHGIQWARSTRRTYCNVSSHDQTVFIQVATSRLGITSGRVHHQKDNSSQPFLKLDLKWLLK